MNPSPKGVISDGGAYHDRSGAEAWSELLHHLRMVPGGANPSPESKRAVAHTGGGAGQGGS